MTESDWLRSENPQEMLAYIRPQASDRRLRLFACACMRLAWWNLENLKEIDAYELHGLGIPDLQLAENWVKSLDGGVPQETKALFLRLIFGNPFRRVKIRPEWLTIDALAMAHTCYDFRTAEPFPFLWDALETAGCDNEEIRRALMWEQRCPKCLGEGIKRVAFMEGHCKGAHCQSSWKMGGCTCDCSECMDAMLREDGKCLSCNGTGWLPIPGEPFCPRGHWVIDLLLGKE